MVVMGATASGKSAVSLHLAKVLGTEIISADARQLYKGMEIGTDAPSEADRAAVPHHFIGIRAPLEPFSAGAYEQAALALLSKLFQRYDILLLVGGSSLYVRAICEGLAPIVPVAEALRQKWRNLATKKDLGTLQAFVAARDPNYYAEVDVCNASRLARAAEVIESTGKPYSLQRKKPPAARPFRVHKVGLFWPRQQLYARIEARNRRQLNQGLWKEARQLYVQYGADQIPPTIGYTEMFAHFAGKCSKTAAEERLLAHNRQYAKRQCTWLRKEPNILWFAAEDISAIEAHVQRLIAT